MSKLLERLVAKQLIAYVSTAHLLPDLQSAYRTHHSTETAVVKELSDILLALNAGNLVMLTMLDLSAVFDTVDHAVLLRRLETSYGLGGSLRLVPFISQWPYSVCSSRFDAVKSQHSRVWNSSGFGAWPNTLHALHGRSHANCE